MILWEFHIVKVYVPSVAVLTFLFTQSYSRIVWIMYWTH